MRFEDKLSLSLGLSEAKTRRNPFTGQLEIQNRHNKWVPHPFKNQVQEPQEQLEPVPVQAPQPKQSSKDLGYGKTYLLDIIKPMVDETPLKLTMEAIESLGQIIANISSQLKMLSPELAVNVRNAFRYIEKCANIIEYQPIRNESRTLKDVLDIISDEMTNFMNIIEMYVDEETWGRYNRIMEICHNFIKEYLKKAYMKRA
jgi:hypothetical protein